MKIKETLLWQPGARARGVVAVCATLSAAGIAYLHMMTGLAYEFHVLFDIPILLVAWLIGARAGYTLAIFSVGLWFFADHMLRVEHSEAVPLLFNTSMRLAFFLGGVWLMAQLRYVLHRESRLAREDVLTQLPNRREFHEQGRHAFAQAQRLSAPFTVAFIDLDHFKEVNDNFGHEAGDRALKNVAAVMLRHVRASDIPGRLGGDEFALLLPNMDADAAATYTENLRQQLLAAMREHGWPVTFSIGVACYRHAPRDFEGALAQADALMYEVKNGGRDRILLRAE